MVLTAHAIVGAAAANIFPESYGLEFLSSYLSHYLADIIPHIEYDISGIHDKETKNFRSVFHNAKSFLNVLIIGLDFFIGVASSLLIFVHDRKTLIATSIGIIGGVLPDLLQYFYYRTKKWPWTIFQKIHDVFHYPENPKAGLLEGIRNQVLTILIVLILFFVFK